MTLFPTGAAALTIATAASLVSPASAGTLTLTPVSGIGNTRMVIDAAAIPGDPDRILMLDYDGVVRVVDRAAGTSAVVLSGIAPNGVDVRSNWYTGAFSIAAAPDFASSGKFYVSANSADRELVVMEYASSGLVAAPGSERRIATIPVAEGWQAGEHYGGAIGFAPDGTLYVTTGESNTPAGPGGGNPAQDVTSRLGKVLRIDVTGDAYPDDPKNNYAIPAGNPDFGPGADPALWAIGFRNPFKGKVDPQTGLLVIGDVGEDSREEIDVVSAGGNYGWPAYEGSEAFEGELAPGFAPIPPVWELDWSGDDAHASITGGLISHGGPAALEGLYLFSDYLGYGGEGGNAPLRTLALDADGALLGATDWTVEVAGGSLDQTIGFGQDGAGRLYVFDRDLDVFEITAATVPLPTAGLLLAAGLAGLAGVRRRG